MFVYIFVGLLAGVVGLLACLRRHLRFFVGLLACLVCLLVEAIGFFVGSFAC